MGKLKPIGSEKLQGQDKINRIMEIAKYKEHIPQPVNETKSDEYSVQLSDGYSYKIVREKAGYVIKKSINESKEDYIEPMKNRKYYPSYSQAFKRLNLIAKEVNTLSGNESGTSLFGEQKKYTLKTPTPAPAPEPAPEPAPAPAPEPSAMGGETPAADTELPPSDTEAPADDMGMGDEMPEPDMGGDMDADMGGEVTMKTIQKLTGKLGQKIRQFTQENELTSNDAKYVINSVLSAIDLTTLEPEDKDEILARFEGEEMGGEGMMSDEEPMGGEDDMGMGDEMPEPDMGGEEFPQPETEMGEGMTMDKPIGKMSSIGMAEVDTFGDAYGKKVGSIYSGKLSKALESNEAKGVSKILDNVFTESKVEKIITKYFNIDENEKTLLESKNKKKINHTFSKVSQLCESYNQENTSKKIIEKNPDIFFVGKTNKNNLLFQLEGKKILITPEGKIL